MDKWCTKRVSILIVMFTSVILAVGAYAADIENAGFRKDVSSASKGRFSLCDEFLDVKWIDNARSVGILKADIYKNNIREPYFLIVYLEKPGTKAFAARGNGIFYEITEKQYLSRDFEQFLRGAHFSFSRQNVFMKVKKGKKLEWFPQEPVPFEAFVTHQTEFPNRSFSDFQKTICVAYPDAKRVFVAEAKKPFIKLPLNDKSKEAYDIVARYAKGKCGDQAKTTKAECNLNYLADSYALDSNRDGKDDFIFLIADNKNGKEQLKRYLLLSSKDGYAVTDISGCLGFGRFFYGYADSKAFHLGRCSR